MLQASTEEVAEVSISYGAFLQTIIDFVIIGLAMFVVIKSYESMKKKEEETAPAEPPKQEVLLEEIRDLIKKK